MSKITSIKKRNGQIVAFNQDKIAHAIWKAAQSVGGTDRQLSGKIATQVTGVLEIFCDDSSAIPTVEQIQDLVEKILIENGHAKTAKAYILYRKEHSQDRQLKQTIIGKEKETKFSYNALKVLEQRYLKKDENGNVDETPEQLFQKVAKYIAAVDKTYNDFDEAQSTKTFYEMMYSLEFLPNSPTLMNSGTETQQLSACFVLPIENRIEQIFETVKQAALIQHTGGGTGFNFSQIPPKSDVMTAGENLSAGPVAFIKVFDAATAAIRQTGKRRGANMAILNVNHPDILDFINAKDREDMLTNFNISVGITEQFMRAVEDDQMYNLIHPQTGKVKNSLHARSVLDLIATKAWQNGEPGIIFLDRIEKDNPTPKIAGITATNPCGEQPLLPFEACTLGSINLSKFYADGKIDWPRLKETVTNAVHFLDNAIDATNYNNDTIKKQVLANRKIGLGVMGFADLLYQLGVPYNSQQAEELAGETMQFIQTNSHQASERLAEKRGSFPNFDQSVYPARGTNMLRNATLTTIAPTGSISMIAETSPGIEPAFALAYAKQVLDGSELIYTNKHFRSIITELNIHSEELMKTVIREGSLRRIPGIPEQLKQTFVVAADIPPSWHVRIQSAFQKYTDNAVSKTVNFANTTTIEDIKNVFLLAHKMECKGITVYRDRSRRKQVLTYIGKNEIENMTPEDKIIDNQTALPFNNDTLDHDNSANKNTEEVIPPPIIQTS